MLISSGWTDQTRASTLTCLPASSDWLPTFSFCFVCCFCCNWGCIWLSVRPLSFSRWMSKNWKPKSQESLCYNGVWGCITTWTRYIRVPNESRVKQKKFYHCRTENSGTQLQWVKAGLGKCVASAECIHKSLERRRRAEKIFTLKVWDVFYVRGCIVLKHSREIKHPENKHR